MSELIPLLTAQLAKAKALAYVHRFALVLIAEILGGLLLLWGVIYRPRTCILLAIGCYLLYRYGGKILVRPEA